MYIFYPDVYFFTQFVTSIFAIAVSGSIYKISITRKRLILAGTLFGIVSTILVMVVTPFRLYTLLVHILLIPATLYVACRPNRTTELLKTMLISYVAIWMLYGCVEWITNHISINENLILCGCATVLYLLVAMINQVRLRKNAQVPVILCHKGKQLSLTGFCDTGNLLTEPYGGRPVHVIDNAILEPFLKETEEEKFYWIPYKTVSGNEMMKGYTLDEMVICKKKPTVIKKVVVGMSKSTIFQGDSVQLLLNVSQLNL